MSFVVEFFRFLQKALRWCLFGLVGVAGQIGVAVVGVVGAVSTAFSRFTWLATATSWVNDATTSVRSLVDYSSEGLASLFLHWFSLDRAVQVAIVVVTSTVGATVAAIITLFLAVMAIVPTVLIVRAILKSIQTATGGIIDP